MSGSTGNLRRNEHNEKLGDGIFCAYPDTGIEAHRSLDFIGEGAYAHSSVQPAHRTESTD